MEEGTLDSELLLLVALNKAQEIIDIYIRHTNWSVVVSNFRLATWNREGRRTVRDYYGATGSDVTWSLCGIWGRPAVNS
jgi:hypothetical protein